MLFTLLTLVLRAAGAPAASTAYTSSRRSLLGGRRSTVTTVTGPRAVIVATNR